MFAVLIFVFYILAVAESTKIIRESPDCVIFQPLSLSRYDHRLKYENDVDISAGFMRLMSALLFSEYRFTAKLRDMKIT